MVEIFVEGGGTSDLDSKLRKALTKLFESSGFKRNLPRIIACGTRNEAFKRFNAALKRGKTKVYLLVDSETIPNDINQTWEHLANREGDKWTKPDQATDENVFFMTTCTETWLFADSEKLVDKLGKCLNINQLPNLKHSKLEEMPKLGVYNKLESATKSCDKSWTAKRGKSLTLEWLKNVRASKLKIHLPSFNRMLSILNSHLTTQLP